MKREYLAKVINDRGLTRGRVPTAVLNVMGARSGDSLIFSFDRFKRSLRASITLEGHEKSC